MGSEELTLKKSSPRGGGVGSVSREDIMKKRFLYPLIIIAEIVVLTILAKILGLETNSGVYGYICGCTLFLTFIIFMLKAIKDYKSKYPVIKLLYFHIIIIIIVSIVAWFAGKEQFIPLNPP